MKRAALLVALLYVIGIVCRKLFYPYKIPMGRVIKRPGAVE